MIEGFIGAGIGGVGFTGAGIGGSIGEVIVYTRRSSASPSLVWVGGEEKGTFSKNLTSVETKYLQRLG